MIKKTITLIALLGTICFLNLQAREKLNFNSNWKFIKANPTGTEKINFNDSAWKTVSAPHTFNDIDTFDNWSTPGHVGELIQWQGQTCYRKTFALSAKYADKKIFIEFEAVRQIADVYINEHYLGRNESGFSPFGFDLTPYLNFEQKNVITVKVDNRFYHTDHCNKHRTEGLPWNDPHWHPAHGGLYRNIFLHITDKLHVTLPLYSNLKTTGTYVYSKKISSNIEKVFMESQIKNDYNKIQDAMVHHAIIDQNGVVVTSSYDRKKIAPNSTATIKTSNIIENPHRWEPESPYLYTLITTVKIAGKIVDAYKTTFGIRHCKFDKQNGFYINDHYLKLHGWGQKSTDEWPGLGAAQPDWMHAYTLSLMKNAGGNFVRWGHTAGAPVHIKAADKYGIITLQPGVDAEGDISGHQWDVRAKTFRDVIIYFRNNPSILIWEGGNQSVSDAHIRQLTSYVKKYDPHGGRAYAHRRANAVVEKYLDISISTEGSGYRKALPTVEGEYNREESPRRVWDDFSPPDFDYKGGKGQTYDLTSEQFAVNQVAQYVRKIGMKSHCGGANWIFTDSTSGGRVGCEVARTSGEMDGVRLPKEAYFVCKTMFSDTPQVHIIGHWTYPKNTIKNIYVVSNCEKVELFINNKSLGFGEKTDHFLFTWEKVKYHVGEIKAVAYNKQGKVLTQQRKITAGKPHHFRLTYKTSPKGLQATGSDVALIDVEVVDKDGNRCPTFEQRVDFEMTGSAIWRGGYNSGKINSINNKYLYLECGINRVSVRSTNRAGEIYVTVKKKGLPDATINITSHPVTTTNGITTQLPTIPNLQNSTIKQKNVQKITTILGDALKTESQTGRYICEFSYSGPNHQVKIGTSLRNGDKIYVDSNSKFKNLPKELLGADWTILANNDRLYNAVDLMTIAVNKSAKIYVLHDDRLQPRPAWLRENFKNTKKFIKFKNTKMSIFSRTIKAKETLTLGTNTENNKQKNSYMYIVLVK